MRHNTCPAVFPFYNSNINGATFADAIIKRTDFRFMQGQKSDIYYSDDDDEDDEYEEEYDNHDGKNMREFNKGHLVSILEGADFTNSIFEEVEFDDSELDHANFTGASLSNVSFTSSQIRVANFTKTTLMNCDFSDCDLRGTSFQDSCLSGCNFADADLSGTIFPKGIDLTDLGLSLEQQQVIIS